MDFPKTTEPPSVVCAGVIVADHVSSPIDHAPAPGELVPADDLFLSLGGNAANVALGLAKLAVRAQICGRVGADPFGRFIAETLEAGGVDVGGLAVDPVLPTSQTLLVNVRGEDRRFIHSFGANRGLRVDDLQDSAASAPRVFYLGGYLILPGLDPFALADLFARLRDLGTFNVLDVVVPGPGPHLEALRPVLPHVDAFLPNRDESAIILGETDPIAQAEAFRDLGARCVVITDGAQGAWAISDGLRVHVPAYSVDCLDGSGGGDAFDAGYIAGYLEGRDEPARLALASAVGASCVRALGTTAGVFGREEAEEFLSENPSKFRTL